jgi:hypothetical protein
MVMTITLTFNVSTYTECYTIPMQILKELLVGLLTGYLAFTNFLAVHIEQFFTSPPDTGEPKMLVGEPSAVDTLIGLPSRIGRAIPDILLRSTEYQQATIIETQTTGSSPVSDPLTALVNIYCTLTGDSFIRTTTGTGFFIDSDGIILTNAHIAQFLLLAETNYFGDASCIVRTGDPAAPRYIAELLYISPAWVQDNASILSATNPMGTGERDYGLLYVTESFTKEPLPAQFPTLALNTENLKNTTKGATVSAAGYPAAGFATLGPSADLIPKIAETTISELYTFGSNYADVFSIKGSAVGAEGASGGPVVNDAGEVIGVIVTRGDDNADGPGSLRAITLSHIERTITEETGNGLERNLQGNLPYRAKVFRETLTPFLVSILEVSN